VTVLISLAGTVLTITPVIVLILLVSPLLDRRYAVGGRYVLWILVMISLAMPLLPFMPEPVFLINMPVPAAQLAPATDLAGAGFEDYLTEDAYALGAYGHTAVPVDALPSEIVSEGGAGMDLSGAGLEGIPPADMGYSVYVGAYGGSYADTYASAYAETPTALPVRSGLAGLGMDDLLIIIWLSGIAISLVFQMAKHVMFMRHVSRWGIAEASTNILGILEKEALRLGINRKIRLKRCKGINAPMLVGFMKPTVLLPDSNYDAAELVLIFRHEMTHLRRLDLWYKLALVAVKCVYWFNPAVHLMARQAGKDIEIICDMLTVRNLGMESKRKYSKLILSLASSAPNRSLLTTSMEGDKNMLKKRFSNILGAGKKRGILLFSVLGIIIIATACTVGAGLDNNLYESGAPESSAHESSDGEPVTLDYEPLQDGYLEHADNHGQPGYTEPYEYYEEQRDVSSERARARARARAREIVREGKGVAVLIELIATQQSYAGEPAQEVDFYEIGWLVWELESDRDAEAELYERMNFASDVISSDIIEGDNELRLLQESYDLEMADATGQFVWPVPRSRMMSWPSGERVVSSPFGERMHPIFHVMRQHTGIDIAAPAGTDVVAVDYGTVLISRFNEVFGNMIVISHGEIDGIRVVTMYAQLHARGVRAGDAVSPGQVIGQVGSTGISTGPHLHFEVFVDGVRVDPLGWVG